MASFVLTAKCLREGAGGTVDATNALVLLTE